MELILGTAEFNPEGYAGKPRPSTKEILRIFNLAWEGGIRTLDCAVDYYCEDALEYALYFDKMIKSRKLGRGQWYHYKQTEERIDSVEQASVYTIEQFRGLKKAVVPFNIDNLEFVGLLGTNIVYARSVFDRGRLLEKGYTVKDCLSFVKRHPLAGVIVGVNSVKELEEILKAW